MDSFLLVTISFFVLLGIASYASVLAKKFGFPYTILLFIIGIAFVNLGKLIPALHSIAHIELSKDLVFYIFLPTLIFESAYNIPHKKILRDLLPISMLSIISLLLSASIIGFCFTLIMGWCGFHIPYLISFLFGAIISATDPVAVLAIFKEFGVPKRIMYLFEGESLFNDGTAVALFLILFGIIQSGSHITTASISTGILSFCSMLLGGAIFGIAMGWLFSNLIQKVQHSWAELTLTLLLAHTTFILADLISEHLQIFKISAIIATTLAALTLGNYGRYKISKDVREMMETTWGYLAFVSNSLIFLLMGMLIGKINFHFQTLIVPIFFALLIVLIARMLSVFAVLSPLNRFLRYPIDFNWQKLIAWGSLRGAIAITMLLFIPPDLTISGWNLSISVREFLSVIVISCIVFTLIIKATSMKVIIKKMKLADLTKEEEFVLHQIKDLVDKSILKKLLIFHGKKYVPEEVLKTLVQKYKLADALENKEIKKCALKKGDFKILLKKYALGIERHTALELFESQQIGEHALKKILNKIETQYMRIELGKTQTKTSAEKKYFIYPLQQKIQHWLHLKQNRLPNLKKDYVFYRARCLVAEKVLEQLEVFRMNFYSDPDYSNCFEQIMNQYETWAESANKKIYKISTRLKTFTHFQESKLFNNHLVYLEEDLINQLYSKHIMSSKVYHLLRKAIWK